MVGVAVNFIGVPAQIAPTGLRTMLTAGVKIGFTVTVTAPDVADGGQVPVTTTS